MAGCYEQHYLGYSNIFGVPICTLLLMYRKGIPGSQNMNKFSFILPNDLTAWPVHILSPIDKDFLNTWYYWLSFILAISIFFKESLVLYDTYVFFFHKHQKEILWEVLIYTFNQALASAVLQSCWEVQFIWRESEVSTQMLRVFENFLGCQKRVSIF